MVTLHPLFTDHAVISARRPRILGRAAPGSAVTVTLAGSSAATTADAEGGWRVEFPALPAGGPHVLIARSGAEEVCAKDILLGEVWLGSGQSNMEWMLAQTKDVEADMAKAHEPLLRLFTVDLRSEIGSPGTELSGRWSLCTPLQVPTWSAVGYYFGRHMTTETGLPVGLVISAWGGSAIAPWLPLHVLDRRPEYAVLYAQREAAANRPATVLPQGPHEDPGLPADARDWSSSGCDDSSWGSLQVPGTWQNQGWGFNGAVWYRRTVQIPAEWVGHDLELSLGIVDDCDHTFVNGTLVGQMGTETPSWWATPRLYRVPAGLVTTRTLQLAVRVFDLWGEGGMVGNLQLARGDRPELSPIKLSGRWLAKAELELPLRSPSGLPETAPCSLWNGMIAPLLGASLDGVLWYQGESDVARASLYPRLLTDLITSWRTAFDSPNLPFGIVQLANYMARKDTPSEDPWAELREAQRLTALNVPGCGLALAIDVGEADDIHPRDKKTVGDRLALWALRTLHRRTDFAYSGPLPAEIWPEADGLCIRFTHAEGLRVRGDALRGFQISGADRQWVWADEAKITGDTVWVRATSVRTPTAVRYAWQANPETTLENAACLPASPFRTDQPIMEAT